MKAMQNLRTAAISLTNQLTVRLGQNGNSQHYRER